MDHIGIDVHKKESQLCILGEDGELSERRIRTTPERFAASWGPAAGPHPPRGFDGERVGGAVSGRVRPRGHRCRPELRPHVRRPQSEDQDGSARRPGAGRGLSAGGLPARPSALRCPAPCARALDGARRVGAHPHGVYQRGPGPAPARRLAGGQRQRGGVHSAGSRLGAARPAAVGARPPARRHAPGQSAGRILGRADCGGGPDGRPRRRLQTVPSVGPVTAAAFVAALDDAGRFARAHQVEAY